MRATPPRVVWLLRDLTSGYSEVHGSRAAAEKWKRVDEREGMSVAVTGPYRLKATKRKGKR